MIFPKRYGGRTFQPDKPWPKGGAKGTKKAKSPWKVALHFRVSDVIVLSEGMRYAHVRSGAMKPDDRANADPYGTLHNSIISPRLYGSYSKRVLVSSEPIPSPD